MIHFVTGNLLDTKADALVNTVNTVGVMGKGIALQFKEAFPENYKKYKSACKKSELETGKLLVTQEFSFYGQKYIINFPTKEHWRQPSRYEYIEKGLEKLKKVILDLKINSVALPPLGCGNGGLEWQIVKSMITDSLEDLPVEIYVYEPNNHIKTVLEKEHKKDVALTAPRAMLLYALYHYEAMGEYSSLFSANKLAYFLQRMGENLKLQFKANLFGPYAVGVQHVLYHLNGKYLNGLEQKQAKAFEPLKLNYSKFKEVKEFVDRELSNVQKQRLDNLLGFIDGFQSELSLEILSSVAFLIEHNPQLNLEGVINGIHRWNDRKKRLFKDRYISIAYNHIRSNTYNNDLFASKLPTD